MFRTLTARRIIRKMRGCSQAHLVQTEEDEFFIVKAKDNPQHSRVPVNEAFGTVILRQVGVCAPEPALVVVPPEVLTPEMCYEMEHRRKPLQPGIYFGSRHPGDPRQVPVYDFIPNLLLQQLDNIGDFYGALVVDKWASNSDGRQAVFCRAFCTSPLRAYMIDAGNMFGEAAWLFRDAPLAGLYFAPVVYQQIRSLDDFEPWLTRARLFPEGTIDAVYRAIPSEWIDSRPDLEALLDQLLARRSRIPDLLLDCRAARPAFFPNWRRPLARPVRSAPGRNGADQRSAMPL
jgi:hypothetical protein